MKQRNKTLSKSNEQFRDKKIIFKKQILKMKHQQTFSFLNTAEGYVLPSQKHNLYKRISNLNKRKQIQQIQQLQQSLK